jgi:hypothetical protein
MGEFDSAILECLHNIEAAVSGDKYENLGIWTYGGGNGVYTMKVPVNTECEWTLYALAATGACQVMISHNQGQNTLAITGGVSYGTGGGNEGNGLEGMFTPIPAAGFFPTSEQFWQPVGRGSALYALITGLSSQSAFILLAWRRLLNREIPTPPRGRPQTHTTRESHRPQRVLAAASPFTQGFEEQTVVPGAVPYQHAVVPTASDVAGMNRSIDRPLTPAEILLAKLRGNKGVY